MTIVTASFNMAKYLPETIESVLGQDYPNIEYVVMDAGSTDSTIAILQSYAGRLLYNSEPDGGTADAIGKGFARANGSILAFLNADDTYLPGAVTTVVRTLAENPQLAMVYGEGNWVNQRGEIIVRYPSMPFDPSRLSEECFICQPTAFFRREAYEAVGGINPTLHYTFDYDLWIRFAKRFGILKIDDYLATSRMHAANKTLSQPRRATREAVDLLSQHYGFIPPQWVVEYLRRNFSGRDAFRSPRKRPVPSYCLALPLGIMLNRRHPMRYLSAWTDLLLVQGFKRWRGERLRRLAGAKHAMGNRSELSRSDAN